MNSRARPYLFLLSLAIAGLAHGGCDGPKGPVGNPGEGASCTDHAQCLTGLLCLASTCQPASAVDCTTMGCPSGYECMANGNCQALTECTVDGDCCPGDVADCGTTCLLGECIGDECIPGTAAECFVGCHRGQRSCDKGIWTPCDAPPVLAAEACNDAVDNDCNGQTDEGCPECQPGQQEACETPCGVGTRSCDVVGNWEPCTASLDCVCEPGSGGSQPCGLCGFKDGICGADGIMTYADTCLSEGDCEPGVQEAEDCGGCGQMTRTCDAECGWGDWGECANAGACAPGDTEQRGCDECGSQTRSCLDHCGWGEWSPCDTQGGCVAGETQDKECGMCGAQVSTCDSQCQWSDYGVCTDEGACVPLTPEIEDCGQCGHRQRSCGLDCQWGLWSSCLEEGACAIGGTESEACGPATELGQCAFGSRLRTCNAECQWNPWNDCLGAVYPADSDVCGNGVDEDCDGSDLNFPDEHEGSGGNNTCATCTYLGSEPDELTLVGGFHGIDDTLDFYCFDVVDDSPTIWSLWLDEEHILVDLEDQPFGVDADLFLYKGTSACEIKSASALAITIGPDDEHLDWNETNDDDSGFYILEVKNFESPSCFGNYKLTIDGLR